jgi:tetratricopeptide (TPR) repeat protein
MQRSKKVTKKIKNQFPVRTREHQLDDLSNTFLENVLPVEWKFTRSSGREYGVDGEVEIFEEDGAAKGTKFYVQLKSSDADLDNKFYNESLKTSTYNYWMNLDMPVLILKFSTKENRMYFRWIHEFLSEKDLKKQASFTFKFNPQNWLNDLAFITIKRDVNKYKRYLREGIQLPLKVSFRGDELTNWYEVSNALEELFLEKKRFIEIVDDPDCSDIEVNLNDQQVFISLAGKASTFKSSFHLVPATREVCNYVIAGLIMLLHLKKPKGISLLIDEIISEEEFLLTKLPIGKLLLSLALEDENETTFKSVYEFLTKSEAGARDYSDYYFILLTKKEKTVFLRTMMKYVLQKQLDIKIAKNENGATDLYNLANQFLSEKLYKNVIFYLNGARKADPTYTTRAYFWNDLGIAFFYLSRYSDAKNCYLKARELYDSENEKSIITAKAADTCFYAGKFDEAFNLYNQISFVPTGLSRKEYYWLFKIHAFLDFYDKKDQFLIYFKSTKDFEDKFCDSLTWIELGERLIKERKIEEAFMCYCWVAYINENDSTGWANAYCLLLSLIGSKQESNPFYILSIVAGAYECCGKYFLKSVEGMCKLNNFPDINNIKRMIIEAIKTFEGEEDKITIRLLDDKGGYKIVNSSKD